MPPFDQAKYNADYIKQNQKQYLVKVNRIHDADMIAWIDSQGGSQTYIKNLIRADMEAHGFKGSQTTEEE